MRRGQGSGVDLEDCIEDVGRERGFKGIDESWRGENDRQRPQMALSFCTLVPDQLKIPGSGHLLQYLNIFF